MSVVITLQFVLLHHYALCCRRQGLLSDVPEARARLSARAAQHHRSRGRHGTLKVQDQGSRDENGNTSDRKTCEPPKSPSKLERRTFAAPAILKYKKTEIFF